MKSILFTIAASIFIANHAIAKTQLGLAIEDILNVDYSAFATESDTQKKQGASCISSVVYGLKQLDFECSYQNFRIYKNFFKSSSQPLILGGTPFDKRGLILYSPAHFAALYEDTNNNQVVDENDTIIHAYFHPVKITTIREWLEQDVMTPVKFVKLDSSLNCPK